VKTLKWWGSRGYKWHPKISFVVCNHNLSSATVKIVNDLRQFDNAEIIVIDDGSTHDHTQVIVNYLNGVNEFVVHANDLFDVIVFNRVFGFAQGEYIAVVQDDDEYKGSGWVDRAVEILDGDPNLSILGGRARITVSSNGSKKIEDDGDFCYAQAINAAPMWVVRSAFLDLGGFSQDFGPMLWHEPEFCIRSWLNGYHVGWYKSGTKGLAIRTRKRRSNKETLECEARAKNFKLLMEMYGTKLAAVQDLVSKQNRILESTRK